MKGVIFDGGICLECGSMSCIQMIEKDAQEARFRCLSCGRRFIMQRPKPEEFGCEIHVER